MVTVYVVLDGFDLGAGVIYLFAAKTTAERRRVLRSIGPVWDGNEVWLLAAGGTLYFAFPQLYASSFSGFYLPLMMVLWLLMLRAIGIEFRAHLEVPVWQQFFDVVFAVSSILLCIFFGAALGNVVRGVPLDATGYFFEPLWTNFKLGRGRGILDWYTVLIGVMALVTLTAHGSYYVALKTDADLRPSRPRFRLAMLAFAIFSNIHCSGRDLLHPPNHHGELSQSPNRDADSNHRRRLPCSYAVGQSQRQREDWRSSLPASTSPSCSWARPSLSIQWCCPRVSTNTISPFTTVLLGATDCESA